MARATTTTGDKAARGHRVVCVGYLDDERGLLDVQNAATANGIR